jgi:Tfp pilus assembly protein FimT
VVDKAVSTSIDLNNGQWVDTGTTIDGNKVYKSDSGSYNINNGESTCTITVSNCSNVTVYLRSYGENSYDYAEVGPLDGTVLRDSSSNVLSTKNKSSDTVYSSYTFNIPDANTHTFQILYSKDSGTNMHDDRGYFYYTCS